MDKVEKVARAIPDEAVEAAEAAFYGRHERGFVLRPLVGGGDMRAAIEAALAAMGEREVVQPLALNDPADDEAARWVMAKLHGIRRDSGTIEYTLAAVIRAYQAGKASAASPRPEAVGEAVKAERHRCAMIGYRVCAETNHVTLADKMEAAIRSGETP